MKHTERGGVSVLMAFLLVAGVLFILGQAVMIIATRNVDTSQQNDSNAALMLGESGLQRARAVLAPTANSGLFSTGDCSSLSGTYSLGRGSFTYGTATTSPALCGGVNPNCDSCTVSVTGTVGNASRTVNQTYVMGTTNGVAGRGTTVTMVLKNTFNVPAVSLFNMAWKRQDPGGNADATYCSNLATDCGLQWNEESSNGNNSIGGLGVTVKIAPLTYSRIVTQTLNKSRDYVEVGGLFPSTSTTSTPTITGTFWDDKNNGHKTAVNTGTTGAVINGVYNDMSGACTPSPTTYPSGGSGSYQADTCTHWCRSAVDSSADTLVFGLSGRGSTAADELTAVRFNTTGQNLAMTRLVHFPNLDGTTESASGLAYSEIWYYFNDDYMSPSGGLGATNYPAAFAATAGALVGNGNISIGNNATSFSVPSNGFSSTNGKICVGDVVSRDSGQDRFASNTTITATPDASTCSTATGTYTISAATTGNMNNISVRATSNKLFVTAQSGTISNTVSTPTSGSPVTISSGPSGGYYTLAAGAYFPTTTTFTQGAAGTTIAVPSGGTAPVAGTILAVYSGTGQFQANTTVLATPAPTATSFTVSAAPTINISGARICGGTCALFNSPSSSSSVTNFSVTKSSGTDQWSGGFLCLKGVDKTKIIPVTATSMKAGRWQEPAQ